MLTKHVSLGLVASVAARPSTSFEELIDRARHSPSTVFEKSRGTLGICGDNRLLTNSRPSPCRDSTALFELFTSRLMHRRCWCEMVKLRLWGTNETLSGHGRSLRHAQAHATLCSGIGYPLDGVCRRYCSVDL